MLASTSLAWQEVIRRRSIINFLLINAFKFYLVVRVRTTRLLKGAARTTTILRATESLFEFGHYVLQHIIQGIA